jgi:carboxymethylenebutenolidase
VQAQDWAKEQLNKSPRHLDWVKVKSGEREVKCFIAYPEVKEKATSVVVIHEIFGLSDWVRSVCDQLAAKGYIAAIAPDLLSGKAGEDSSKYTDVDSQRKAVTSLPAQQVTDDLEAVSKYVTKLPAANGKLAVSGFCWGGMQTFRFATNNPSIKGAFVFYGTAPEKAEDLSKIKAPVFGFYGEKDSHVTPSVEKTKEAMKESHKTFEPKIYDGAGHGFMRSGEAPDADAFNKAARTQAWQRWNEELKKI